MLIQEHVLGNTEGEILKTAGAMNGIQEHHKSVYFDFCGMP